VLPEIPEVLEFLLGGELFETGGRKGDRLRHVQKGSGGSPPRNLYLSVLTSNPPSRSAVTTTLPSHPVA
jgi:hypothetical protein